MLTVSARGQQLERPLFPVGAPEAVTASDRFPPWPAAERQVEPDTEWYGNETLVTDALSVGVAAMGVANDSAPIAIAGLAGLFVGAPLVHLAEGNPRSAVGSVITRTGLPFVLALLAGSQCDEPKGREPWSGLDAQLQCATGVAGGILVGMAAAVVVDAAVLARRPLPRTSQGPARPAWRLTGGLAGGDVRFGLAAGF